MDCNESGDLCLAVARKANASVSSHIGGYVLFSKDAGATWTEMLNSDLDLTANDIVCQPHLNAQNFWIACSDGNIYSGEVSQ